MTIDEAVAQILGAYMGRIQVKPGNGLSRNMNQSIRSYPRLPEIIRHTTLMLIESEMTLAWSGVQVSTRRAYVELVLSKDAWGCDVPVMDKPDPVLVGECLGAVFAAADAGEDVTAPEDDPTLAGTLHFRRIATLPYQQFQAAMTIARRIGLLAGPRSVSLEAAVRRRLKRVIQSAGSGQ
jgi:hypothetical protein